MAKVTGRSVFEKHARLIRVFCKVVDCFPRVLHNLFWSVSNIFDGNISALVRYAILQSSAKSIGDNVFIARNVTIKNPEHLEIGSNVSIHTNCYIDAIGGCDIGKNVSIAHASSIITFNHSWDDPSLPIKYNPIIKSNILIADDVWIGCGVRIMPGVRIASRCVVAAGSVVIKDLASYGVYAGVPARHIKDI